MGPRLLGSKPSTHGAPNLTMHSAGIYADMTVDGPIIGTLVLVVDRAKNLPNLRTVGKQDPYCAARLGKEAKKTDTDMRGGQTPRWDEELRFTVHDSPDYHQLKLSIFNDDKKTDLIGECWVNLDDILHPGGGKSDAWHHLNVKGRYAGEIRLELTYYDSRPKPEKPRKHSTAAVLEQDTRGHAQGPRQAIARRPLPSNGSAGNSPAQAAAQLPAPYAAPRSYHTPPRQSSADGYDEMYDHNGQYYEDGSNGLDLPALPPLPQQHHHHSRSSDYQQVYYEEPSDAEYSDNAYRTNRYAPQSQSVQRLSGAHSGRPAPPVAMHSAPQLAPQELAIEPAYAEPEEYAQDHNGYYSSPDRSYHHHDLHQSEDTAMQPHNHAYAHRPMPAPVHRNSAPVVARPMVRSTPPVQHSTSPSRALHMSTTPQDIPDTRKVPRKQVSPNGSYSQSPLGRSPPQHDMNGYGAPRRQQSGDQYVQSNSLPRSYGLPPHLYGADPTIQPRNELSYDPRLRSHSSAMETDNFGERHAPLNARPTLYEGYAASSPNLPLQPHQSPAIVRPTAVRPVAASTPIPRKPISPKRSAEPVVTAMNAFSPDSFGAINPSHSQSRGNTPRYYEDREPTPMYDTPPAASPVGAATPGSPDPPINPDGTVTTPDGRVKDASDHLPTSSYAPEPERKGNRPNTRVNITNRFGPREAGSPLGTTPPSMSPLATAAARPHASSLSLPPPAHDTRDRLYRRSHGGSGSGNYSGSGTYSGGISPLSPAQQNALPSLPPPQQQHQYYEQPQYKFTQGNPYPLPPKPAAYKSALQNSLQDYESGGEMSSLAADLKMVQLRDDRAEEKYNAPANAGRVKVNGAGRLRKAKWSG